MTGVSPVQTDFYQLCFDAKGTSQASLAQMKSTVVRSQPMMRKSLFKIVILGAAGVGKTELFCRLAKMKPHERAQHFKSRTTDVEIAPGEMTNVEFVDAEDSSPEGHSILSQRVPRYFDASGVLLLYDVTSRGSFAKLDTFLARVRLNIPPDAELLLLGNKVDARVSKSSKAKQLTTNELSTSKAKQSNDETESSEEKIADETMVSFEEADKYAVANGVSLFEVDAKSGTNVNDAIVELLMKIRDKMDLSPFDVDCVELDTADSDSNELNNNGGGNNRRFFKTTTATMVKGGGTAENGGRWCHGWFCI